MQHRRGGSALLDLMIVLALLATLVVLSFTAYAKFARSVKIATATTQVRDTAARVREYQKQLNTLPDTRPGLAALVRPEGDESADGPYFEGGRVPVDPWGVPLKYERFAQGKPPTWTPPFRVWSTGPDRKDGTRDDIASVKRPTTQ